MGPSWCSYVVTAPVKLKEMIAVARINSADISFPFWTPFFPALHLLDLLRANFRSGIHSLVVSQLREGAAVKL